jgi:outer membrane beta-barrel protein
MNMRNHVTRPFTAALLSLGSLAVAGPAFADEGEAEQETEVLDERLKKYWGTKMRDVQVLQKRTHRKETRWEFEVMSGVIPNDEFTTYIPLGGRLDYFFSEDFGAELWGNYLVRVPSDLKDFLEQNFNQSLLVELPQQLQWLSGANFLWSPIHGKLGFLTEKLFHFDAHVAFGVGAVGTTVTKLQRNESKVDIAGNVGLGLRFFLSENVALRYDYRQYFYAADGGGLSHPVELTLGLSFFTSAPE